MLTQENLTSPAPDIDACRRLAVAVIRQAALDLRSRDLLTKSAARCWLFRDAPAWLEMLSEGLDREEFKDLVISSGGFGDGKKRRSAKLGTA